jgi:hypothetical protein
VHGAPDDLSRSGQAVLKGTRVGPASIVGDDDLVIQGGFTVSELTNPSPDAIHAEAARIEPDVVLLDGGDKAEYGQSWAHAAWLHERKRPIAVIMFTSRQRLGCGRASTSRSGNEAGSGW